ncbi:MAG: hypothetical protein JNK65_01745 [Deltaproteobacteria bacterium]|nr:hypothetical protein [Deltaproteobacteria bacterium]
MNLKLYVLGINVTNSRDVIELKRIADAAGGDYYPIASSEEFMEVVEEITKINFSVYDYKGKRLLRQAVGAPAVSLRTGEYKLEVGVEPPIVKEKLTISNGVEKKFFINKGSEGLILKE